VYRSEIIVKVSHLIPSEFEFVRENQVIISSLTLNSTTGDYLRNLIQKKVTAIAVESIRDADGVYPVDEQ
jgi:alanine dehydrogenase